jgi:RNA polymerase sigma-70 factor (sigma-E family)
LDLGASQYSLSPPAASDGVNSLYAEHALGLVRLAFVMLGDRSAAEDVVQDAFLGLYRNWSRLASQDKALAYVRSAVLNNSRAELRQRARRDRRERGPAARPARHVSDSAEAAVLQAEEYQEVLAAVRRLPRRQREALALRFYLSMSPAEAAAVMNVSAGTVKSSTSRAIATLSRILKENS